MVVSEGSFPVCSGLSPHPQDSLLRQYYCYDERYDGLLVFVDRL